MLGRGRCPRASVVLGRLVIAADAKVHLYTLASFAQSLWADLGPSLERIQPVVLMLVIVEFESNQTYAPIFAKKSASSGARTRLRELEARIGLPATFITPRSTTDQSMVTASMWKNSRPAGIVRLRDGDEPQHGSVVRPAWLISGIPCGFREDKALET